MSTRSVLTRFSAQRQPTRRATGPKRSKPVRSTGLPRLYPDHRRIEAVLYRKHFRLLTSQFDVANPLVRVQVGAAAAIYVGWLETSHALSQAKADRLGARRIERLRRRMALEWGPYMSTLVSLKTLAAQHPPASLAEQFGQAHREPTREA